MHLTHRVTDRWRDPDGDTREDHYEAEILADGKPTGCLVRRMGDDTCEILMPGSDDWAYLENYDLRRAIPEAKRQYRRHTNR